MAGLLTGRTAIVTGAAKGLGWAIAQDLHSEGAFVVVADIDGPGAVAAAATLARAQGVPCDVADDAQVARMVERVVAERGSLDILVANAGIATVVPLADLSRQVWREVTSVNLDGVMSSVRYGARAMAASGGGSIVTVASITGFLAAPLIAHYSASKAGVISLTKTAAVEFKAQGVRVNAICPGWVGTDMVLDRVPQFEEALGVDFTATINAAQGRLGEASDVSPLAVFLASDRSRFCTGTAFVVDGGLSASLV